MIRIGICDDNAGARIALEAAVERALERRRSGGAAFFHFSSGEGILQWLDQHAGELDLVFLDIEMGGLDGMETARRIRAADGSLAMVFVTGYSDYVFDGYAVGALGYLMKPPKPEALDDVLERAALLRLRDEDSASFTSAPSGGKSPAWPSGGPTCSTGSWTRRRRLWGRASCGFTSGIWCGRGPWSGWRAPRWSSASGRLCR